MYLFNTAFNPQDQNPVVKYLDSNIIMPFTTSFGTDMIIELGTYEIKTDTSMTPFITEVNEEGFYVADKISTNFVENMNGLTFSAHITIGFNHLEIERQYGKYDDALAYVGGLFGLILAFLAFFMMSLNEYRY